jgi:hypothetical protein
MRRSLTSGVALFGLFIAGLVVFRPSWAASVGLDLWNLPALTRETAKQEQITKELEKKTEIIKHRSAAKQEVIHDLLSKKVTLLEAAAEFQHLTVEPAECPGPGPDYFRGRTEGERYCREVLHWVRAESADTTTYPSSDAISRLEAELETYLESHDGEVILQDK